MLDRSRMVHCIEDALQTAVHTRNPDHHAQAVEQIRVGVTLGFITDAAAAEYVYLLQNGARREIDVTPVQIHRIPQYRDPAASGRIAA